MKHKFLLDVMIIYHAVKGVDQNERPDLTARELIRLIVQNCHTFIADTSLAERYSRHVNTLFRKPALLSGTVNFYTEILFNSAKFVVDPAEAPELPASVNIPPEDAYLVRAALISHPLLVTAEERLLKAINPQQTILGLTALSPSQAIERAKET